MNSTTAAGFECVKCGAKIPGGTLIGSEGPYCVECAARILRLTYAGEYYRTQVAVNERQCHWTYKEGEGFVCACTPDWKWEDAEAHFFMFCPFCGGRIVRSEP